MTKAELIIELKEIFDTDDDVLQLETVLADLSEWDSYAKILLMDFANERLGKTITATEIKEFVTVDDICNALL